MINTELPSTVDSSEDIPLVPRDQQGLARTLADLVRRSRDVMVALIACVGAMSMGFSLGYSSPALQDPELMKLVCTDTRRSWFGSLVTVGAMAGGPLAAMLVGRLGRKTTLILCNVPLAIGWFLIIYATSLVLLYAGRSVSTLCCHIPFYLHPPEIKIIIHPPETGNIFCKSKLGLHVVTFDCKNV